MNGIRRCMNRSRRGMRSSSRYNHEGHKCTNGTKGSCKHRLDCLIQLQIWTGIKSSVLVVNSKLQAVRRLRPHIPQLSSSVPGLWRIDHVAPTVLQNKAPSSHKRLNTKVNLKIIVGAKLHSGQCWSL